MRAALPLVALVAAAVGCGDPRPDPTLDGLRQPTGLQVGIDGAVLFVTNGNWDQSAKGGSIVTLDLVALAAGIDAPADAGARLGRSRPCRPADDDVVECDPSAVTLSGAAVELGSGIGNIAIDRPTGGGGLARLLVTQRQPPAIVWIDVQAGTDGPRLECGQQGGVCDEAHTILAAPGVSGLELPGDPARVVVDPLGNRFAYVPHLLGASLSLVALDGDFGPELADVVEDFYHEGAMDDLKLAGGFGIAVRPCDPAAPPTASRECSRPLVYTSNRYFPSVRQFAVAPGLDLIVPSNESSVPGLNPDVVQSRPFLADLAFERPDDGDRLLLVQTTPAGLVRVDTSVDAQGDASDEILGVAPLCGNPNILAVHRAEGTEPLALVTCFEDGELAVIGLDTFRLLRSVQLGAGANEIAIDGPRQWAYVANTREDTISVVELDRGSPAFLTEIARIGLDAAPRD
ncbi:MAG TPA: hypothetical protein VFG69_01200 [Nannocystaceae bacterium]|nr:hypothetical protein [Nannocystaceae bacterium]